MKRVEALGAEVTWAAVVDAASREPMSEAKVLHSPLVRPGLPRYLRGIAVSIADHSWQDRQAAALSLFVVGGLFAVAGLCFSDFFTGKASGIVVAVGLLGGCLPAVLVTIADQVRLRRLRRLYPSRNVYNGWSLRGMVSAGGASAKTLSVMSLFDKVYSQALAIVYTAPESVKSTISPAGVEEAWQAASWELASDLEIVEAAEGQELDPDVEAEVAAARSRVVEAYQVAVDFLAEVYALDVAAKSEEASSAVQSLLAARAPATTSAASQVVATRALREAHVEASALKEDGLR